MENKNITYDKLLKANDSSKKDLFKITTALILIVAMAIYVKFDLLYFFTNIENIAKLMWDLTGGVFVNLFENDSLVKYFIQIQKPMMETIQMSLIGTFFGAILGFILALLSSPMNKQPKKK